MFGLGIHSERSSMEIDAQAPQQPLKKRRSEPRLGGEMVNWDADHIISPVHMDFTRSDKTIQGLTHELLAHPSVKQVAVNPEAFVNEDEIPDKHQFKVGLYPSQGRSVASLLARDLASHGPHLTTNQAENEPAHMSQLRIVRGIGLRELPGQGQFDLAVFDEPLPAHSHDTEMSETG